MSSSSSGEDYDRIEEAYEIAPETRWCIGWINHDKTTFSPKKKKDENIDEVRLAKAKEWEQSFRAWVGSDPERSARVEHAYNRHFKGFVAPTYDAEPLPLARWDKDGVQLHPHQIAGARRVLANRGGLVGVRRRRGQDLHGPRRSSRGARQEGWVKRPVILVPNSIVWKWEADIRRVLPDYRIAVIGSKKKIDRPRRPQGLRHQRHRHARRARREVDALPGRRVRRRPADLHRPVAHPDERGRRPHLRRRHRGHPPRGPPAPAQRGRDEEDHRAPGRHPQGGRGRLDRRADGAARGLGVRPRRRVGRHRHRPADHRRGAELQEPVPAGGA